MKIVDLLTRVKALQIQFQNQTFLFSVDEKLIDFDLNEGSLMTKVKSKKSNLNLPTLKNMIKMEYDILILELILKCVDVKS
jgi:hypothetical protein